MTAMPWLPWATLAALVVLRAASQRHRVEFVPYNAAATELMEP